MNTKRKAPFVFPAVLCLLWALSATAHAAPAAPIRHELRQADGTTLKAVKWGDELRHGYETPEGYAVRFDATSRNWKFVAVDDRGEITLLPEAAGITPPQGVRKHIERDFPPAGSPPAPRTPQKVIPSAGTGNFAVILISFPDTSTTYSATNFNGLLFGAGTNSMKDYYEEVSYGTFTVSPGPGGIAGWYTASKPHDYYGENDEYGQDKYPGTLVREAVAAAEVAGFDFSPYDQDGDGYVDCVAIVHQGPGEDASSNAFDIWSHSWNLYAANEYGRSSGGPYLTDDGVTVDSYIIMPEVLGETGLISTIGVFAHEYGHALGLPDLYDIDYSSRGVGFWSLMGYGSWCGVQADGDRPSHLDPWCKYVLGWITPTLLTDDSDNQSVEQAATAPDVYQLRSGDPWAGGEYFLVENRQQVGFDEGLPGSGLLIWHIDESVLDEYGRPTNMNECRRCSRNRSLARHYHVALVQADGWWHLERNDNVGDEADPYPGMDGNRSFTHTSTPSSRLWDGTPGNVRITGISDPGPIMTFNNRAIPCSVTLLPSAVSKSLSLLKPVAGFILLAPPEGSLSKNSEIVWSSDALKTLLQVQFGASGRAIMLIVLVRPWLLETGEDIEVSVDDCIGGLQVRLF